MTKRALATLLLGLALAGCGLKGALYLPEKTGEVVIRPGPSATTPTTTPATPTDSPDSAEPDAPGTAPTEPPAPEEPSPQAPQPPTGTERG